MHVKFEHVRANMAPKNYMNIFVLENTFIKVYIYYFVLNIFVKIKDQSCVLQTVSLS